MECPYCMQKLNMAKLNEEWAYCPFCGWRLRK